MTHAMHHTKGLIAFLFLCPVFFSCKKEKIIATPPVSNMSYIDLADKEILFRKAAFSIDLNGDGQKDLLFGTLLVGDPIAQQDKWQWLLYSDINTKLPVNENEEIPVMNKPDLIPVSDFNNYTWYELASTILAQKIISFNQPDYWDGAWKTTVKKYLPFQVLKNGKKYNGWVELSFNSSTEKLVLHKAAISNEPNVAVKAGE